MWPFSTNYGRDTKELTNELPEGLQDFFKENNPDAKHQSIFEITPHQKRVNDVLSRQDKNPEYTYEFDKYKQAETPHKVTVINCAELQQKVMECLRGWNVTSTDPCRAEIKKTTSCVEIQNRALKKMYYQDCVSVEQCSKIRYVIDKLFTENFGQYGDTINDQSQAKFNKDLDNMFYKIWK
jgi:hypothetical protein